MLLWMMPKNMLVKPDYHITRFGDPPVSYEYENCFNCGGECLIELPNSENSFDKMICPVCQGTSEVLCGYPDYTPVEWFFPGNNYRAIRIIPDGSANENYPMIQ